MSPAVVFLIGELTKLAITHIQNMGKFDTLTEAEAQQMIDQITANLPSLLPTPEELEKPQQ